mgnify:CR=1 FL=1
MFKKLIKIDKILKEVSKIIVENNNRIVRIEQELKILQDKKRKLKYDTNISNKKLKN